MFYNSTGLRFAFQKFESVGFFSVFLVFFSWVFSLLFSFCFVGRTSHPSLVSLLSPVSFPLLIYFSSFLIKRKKNIEVSTRSSINI